MNYVYLIGNGFDLAHGLPTSYNHFLLSYLKEAHVKAFNDRGNYEDELIKIERFSHFGFENYCSSIESMNKFRELHPYQYTVKNKFFSNLIDNYENKRWVDIEYEYFLELIALYNRLEKKKLRYDGMIKHELIELNKCMHGIKQALIIYLNTIDYSIVQNIPPIERYFEYTDTPGHSLFLNFNYTTTLQNYIISGGNNTLVNIHGRLDSPEIHAIFGYGDEMDSYYSKIEELNDNDFLVNFKSFGYLQSQSYQTILPFLKEQYQVRIMGHSCGISDRVLLNQIFQNQYCDKISIFYHQISDTKNDYYQKTMEISRHFDSKNKQVMRTKIEDFIHSFPLVPLTYSETDSLPF